MNKRHFGQEGNTITISRYPWLQRRDVSSLLTLVPGREGAVESMGKTNQVRSMAKGCLICIDAALIWVIWLKSEVRCLGHHDISWRPINTANPSDIFRLLQTKLFLLLGLAVQMFTEFYRSLQISTVLCIYLIISVYSVCMCLHILHASPQGWEPWDWHVDERVIWVCEICASCALL